jgi:predicted ferric reductase
VLGFVSFIKELMYVRLHPAQITLFTCNNENDIEYIIRSLKNSFPETQICVVDSESEDLTVAIAERLGASVKRI